MEELAINGGPKAVPYDLPVVENASGRFFGDEELALVTEVMKSGQLNYLSGGGKVARFEQEFAAAYGVSHAVATSSGTASIHAAVIALDLDPGSEVIVAPITDMGTIIPILMQQLIPVFADVDPSTYNVDPASVAEKLTDRTKAVIVVHMFGHPCEMGPIAEFCRARDLYLIEDCCQAFLTKYRDQTCGTIGDIGCFSFQQSKHMTTGDGGMVITNNDALGKRTRLAADKGWPRDGEFRDHLFLAPAYHMTEIQAAVGIAQLGKLQSIVDARRANADKMRSLISRVPGVRPPVEHSWATHTYWKYPIAVDIDSFSVGMQHIADALKAEGIQSWAGYTKVPIYQYDILTVPRTFGKSGWPISGTTGRTYTYGPGLCPNAERALREMIVLPWSERYTDQHLADLSSGLAKVFRHYYKG
ncbi:MAG: DegT/DnrJ/EryC1/StrS family aminotransferase [Armatimonadota bacterium]|nr:DegT/DnrJ/EryC1/StrS family aminotransferase [Armatimonadota bacterium]